MVFVIFVYVWAKVVKIFEKECFAEFFLDIRIKIPNFAKVYHLG